jgi:hypothetical protein
MQIFPFPLCSESHLYRFNNCSPNTNKFSLQMLIEARDIRHVSAQLTSLFLPDAKHCHLTKHFIKWFTKINYLFFSNLFMSAVSSVHLSHLKLISCLGLLHIDFWYEPHPTESDEWV